MSIPGSKYPSYHLNFATVFLAEMVKPRKRPLRLLKTAKAFLAILYNDRFCWTFIKSYGLFALAIPLAKSLDGFEILPASM